MGYHACMGLNVSDLRKKVFSKNIYTEYKKKTKFTCMDIKPVLKFIYQWFAHRISWTTISHHVFTEEDKYDAEKDNMIW